jgi:hypothetical protein
LTGFYEIHYTGAGVTEELVAVIKSLYIDAKTYVSCKAGMAECFEVKVGVHQGSSLSPLLLIIVLDLISKGIHNSKRYPM